MEINQRELLTSCIINYNINFEILCYCLKTFVPSFVFKLIIQSGRLMCVLI